MIVHVLTPDRVIGLVVHRQIYLEKIDQLDVEVALRTREFEAPSRDRDARAPGSCAADNDLEYWF